jgi:hypothetical protein
LLLVFSKIFVVINIFVELVGLLMYINGNVNFWCRLRLPSRGQLPDVTRLKNEAIRTALEAEEEGKLEGLDQEGVACTAGWDKSQAHGPNPKCSRTRGTVTNDEVVVLYLFVSKSDHLSR